MALPPRFLKVERVRGVSVVRLTANMVTLSHIDFNKLDGEVLAEIGLNGPMRVLLSFANVEYFHSQGISFLLRLRTKLQERGGELRLCSLQPQTSEILGLTHVANMFTIYTSEPSALDDFGTAES